MRRRPAVALALCAAAALAACGGHEHPAAGPSGSVPPGTAVPLSYAYQVVRTTGATTTASVTAVASLTVGFATSLEVREAVLVVPDSVPATCVVSADLVVPTTGSGGLGSAKVAAYPSALLSAAGGAPTIRDEGDDRLATTPAAAGTLAGSTYTFDLTALYARWQRGGTFPGSRTAVAKGTPLVVVVRATSYADEPFVFTADASAVHLQLVTTPGCTG